MKGYLKITVMLIFCFNLLIGCNASKEEVINQTKQMVETSFTETANEPNEKGEGFSYYLPDGMKVKEESLHNIILQKGSQKYILFVNPKEAPNSKTAYNELVKTKDVDDFQTFEDEERFGYVGISPNQDKKYELIIGIGGVKLTTITSVHDMIENSKMMMEIVNSVQYNEEIKEQEE